MRDLLLRVYASIFLGLGLCMVWEPTVPAHGAETMPPIVTILFLALGALGLLSLNESK